MTFKCERIKLKHNFVNQPLPSLFNLSFHHTPPPACCPIYRPALCSYFLASCYYPMASSVRHICGCVNPNVTLPFYSRCMPCQHLLSECVCVLCVVCCVLCTCVYLCVLCVISCASICTFVWICVHVNIHM